MVLRNVKLLVGVGLLLALVSVAAGARSVSYKTGTYKATTSQGQTFKFKVQAHTASNHCGTSSAQHCFIAVTYPHASQSCGGGPLTDAGVYPIPNGFLSAAGRFAYRQKDPDESFVATLKGAKATGSFRTSAVSDLGNGPVTCDTGTVTWKATRVG